MTYLIALGHAMLNQYWPPLLTATLIATLILILHYLDHRDGDNT